MNEGSCASPVFIRRVGVKNLRCGMRFDGCVHQACALIGFWIEFRQVGEGEQVSGKEQARHGLGIARWLRKAMIEAATAGAGYVRDHAVHHLAALLVGIEVLIEEVAQETST